ncbi:MAG TPA: hypothetical protein PLL10_03350, partial [Elusimicrobiales bacterium]|nr:hypothetical protein [Elusimicrobiales bacterium]
MNRNMFLAFVLAIASYFVWLKWMEHKYPRQPLPPVKAAAVQTQLPVAATVSENTAVAPKQPKQTL